MKKSEQTKKTIDWITFFPAAMLSCAMAWTVVYIGLQFIMKLFTGPASTISQFLLQLLPNMAFGASAVYVATKLAPAYKKHVAMSICALVVLMAVALGYSAQTSWDLFGAVSMIIGSVAAVLKNINAATK